MSKTGFRLEAVAQSFQTNKYEGTMCISFVYSKALWQHVHKTVCVLLNYRSLASFTHQKQHESSVKQSELTIGVTDLHQSRCSDNASSILFSRDVHAAIPPCFCLIRLRNYLSSSATPWTGTCHVDHSKFLIINKMLLLTLHCLWGLRSNVSNSILLVCPVNAS